MKVSCKEMKELIEKVPLTVHEIIEKIQQKTLSYNRKRKRKYVDSCPNFNLLTQSSQSSDNVSDHATTNISASVDHDPAKHSVAADMEKNDSDKKIVLYSSVDERVYVSPFKIVKHVAHLDDHSDLHPTLKSKIKNIKEIEAENEKVNFGSYKGKEVAGGKVPPFGQSTYVVEKLLGRGKKIHNASWHLTSPYNERWRKILTHI
nr:uncharacterized protein LOC117279546 [Nicotiana tomentosiformis]